MKISYNTITYKRLDRFWVKILMMKEYFDEVRVVDTSNDNDVKQFCKMHGITYIPFDMKLDIMAAHNCWIEAGKAAGDSWFAWCDSDEWLPRDFLRNMRKWCEDSNNGEKYNIIKTVSYDMSLDFCVIRSYEDNLKALNSGTLSPWYEKEPVAKLYPSARMEGLAHPNLVGFQKRYKHVGEGYYHSKTIKENGESAVVFCFNAVVTGHQELSIQAAYNHSKEELVFLKDFFSRHNLDTITKFRKFLNDGNVPQDLKNFMFECKNQVEKYEKNAGWNNSRLGWFILYFGILHPEECPEEHKSFFNGKFLYRGNNGI